ncbi:glutathione S-transferase t2-like protein [Sesbania bispinosa]|nr:glutathione S-transferase t2-like protein [Sesbania bispinosa]
MGSIGGNTSEKETPSSDFASESQTPPFCTQGGLENVTLEDEDDEGSQRSQRVRFTEAKDKLLIQSWLNVSKDVVGTNQKANSFWGRIKDNYNAQSDLVEHIWERFGGHNVHN